MVRDELDENYSPCMSNAEIYVAGGFGWLQRQHDIIDRDVRELEEEENA